MPVVIGSAAAEASSVASLGNSLGRESPQEGTSFVEGAGEESSPRNACPGRQKERKMFCIRGSRSVRKCFLHTSTQVLVFTQTKLTNLRPFHAQFFCRRADDKVTVCTGLAVQFSRTDISDFPGVPRHHSHCHNTCR